MSDDTKGGTGGLNHPVVVSPLESRFVKFPAGTELVEPDGESPGATYPDGFLAAGVVAGLKESGRPDVGVLAVAPQWRGQAASAGVFTTNAFAAAPVLLNRTECDLDHLVAVAMNSANANACTGEPGLVTARAMQQACAEALNASASQVAVCSTGIIGVQLDAEAVAAGVKKATAALHAEGGRSFNHSIMTTDRFPKISAVAVDTPDGLVKLGVCGKGAGMISPAMATMLCAVTCDAVLEPAEMRVLLKSAVDRSFNRVTVDGEMSTNDTVLFLASGASGVRPGMESLKRIGAALDAILLRVALMIVADGEGSTKIMRLRVEGAETQGDALKVARAIADSPLVKTAMHGGDPNWGRIISSTGAAMAGRSLPAATLDLCGVRVVKGGAASAVSAEDGVRMTTAVKAPEVDIELDLGVGNESTEIYFADLGHEYITINAEYHS
ncbi:MAG: bifunctional glutamate N-acetyltransferase/amino-acid acetyltransferase ArgJ [Thermoleophilia bacterium]|nr:bifunctional glutamate N-acetyltransferase/amino-acid acetyltransferase ArgJ [Thermoleophilia bacterium]